MSAGFQKLKYSMIISIISGCLLGVILALLINE
jgi:hypothetical protein